MRGRAILGAVNPRKQGKKHLAFSFLSFTACVGCKGETYQMGLVSLTVMLNDGKNVALALTGLLCRVEVEGG